MASLARWTAIALAIAAVGCNAVLGNEVHELAPASSPDASLDAPGLPDGPPVGQGDGARQDVTQGAMDTGKSDTVVIHEDAEQDRAASDVSASDVSASDVATPDGADTEDANDAAAPCASGTNECRGRNVYTCSRILGWVETLQCPNACSNGSCTGVCVPGSVGCSGQTPQSCDTLGQWQNGATCSFLCNQGQCAGACVPNTTQPCGNAATCNAGATQRCDQTGTWGDCSPTPSTCLAVPANWQAVALTQSTSCPDGFGARQTYYTSATGAAFTCSCGCGGTQSCSGTATLNHYGPDAGAACSGSASTRSVPLSSACSVGNFGTVIYQDAYTISNVAFGPAPSCSATPTPTAQPAPVTQTTGVCSLVTACPSGACLTTSQAANMCIAQNGTQTCPNGYPNRTIMSPTFDDTRSCGACACGSTLACTLSGLVLNNDSNACTTGHPYWMTASTACDSNAIAPSTFPLNAVQAVSTSTGDGACTQTSPSTPTGGVALNAASTLTVCCP